MKVKYNNILFDSELEVEYYKHLEESNLEFIYHPSPIQINKTNKYTPDFIVMYEDRIEIVETKGYSQFSFMKDNMVHNVMLEKTEAELTEYVEQNGINISDRKIVYKKIKYLKAFGWVDYGFKNPNTIVNQQKNKIKDLMEELKAVKNDLKDFKRYFSYLQKDKLTKSQEGWKGEFEEKWKEEQ